MNEPNIIIDETLAPESRRCELSIGHGCEFCHNDGQDMCAKAKEGCYKLHEYDWLAEYPDNGPTDIVEVRFKNTHRSYYANVNNLPLAVGDIVAVEASPGHDIGIVSLTGDMVARQMRRVGFNPQNGEFRKVYRKARPYDIEKWHEAVGREHEVMIRSRQIAADMGLDMKIGDVEFQGDGIKAIFYYIADERVDFRELIKVFAEQFRIRIEMKQIGARQEAGRIGGLGACGRQLCCASWISSFNSVTTNAARTQDLSLNPQKLAGQCSKLKCCLTYELDDYLDARKEFPRVNGPLQALDADYFHVKNDILARTMSFSTQPGSMAGLVTLSIGRVREIMRLNAEGKKPEKITSDTVVDVAGDEPTYINVIGEDSITRFDKAKRNKKRKNKNNKGGQPQGEGRKEQQGESKGEQPKADKPRHDKPKGENKSQQGENKPKGENKPQQGEKTGGEGGDKPRNEGGDKPRNEGGERPRNNRNNRNRSRNHNRGPREGGAQQSNGQQGGGQQPKGGNGQQE
jgi:cell fate regulator YaaT (PSP1 superfamily)